MGRATIISGGTDGLYTVTMDYGSLRKAALLAYVDGEIVPWGERVNAAKTSYDIQKIIEEAARTEALDAVDANVQAMIQKAAAETAVNEAQAALEALAANQTASPAQIEAAQTALAEAQAALATAKEAAVKADKAYVDATTKLRKAMAATVPLQTEYQSLQNNLTRLLKDRVYWTSIEAEKVMTAYCADFTEDASGIVATIEMPGEDATVVIAPAGSPPANDGFLIDRALQSPEQAFFNAAILPGWQKYKPTYRRGVITALDESTDTANVSLYADASSAQGLDVNQTDSLSGVPVRYMTCNAGAFSVGDKCVVEFAGQDWGAPTVIGFVDGPKPCGYLLQYFVSAYEQRTGDYLDLKNAYAMGPTEDVQRVQRGKDAKPVVVPPGGIYSLPYPAGQSVQTLGIYFSGWGDGVATLSRHDLNVQGPFAKTALVTSTGPPATTVVLLSTKNPGTGTSPASVGRAMCTRPLLSQNSP